MNHTFVICAYQESQYLEDCIQSLKNQTVPCQIILTTSTPSEYLKILCQKYDISYRVREGEPGIAADWNYALSQTDTEYVTIAHQDDVYEPDYLENVQNRMVSDDTVLIAFSDYYELVNGHKYDNRINLRVKRVLLYPLRKRKMQNRQWRKRWVLRYGNAISCPTVTYHMSVIRQAMQQNHREELFEDHFKSNLDWETWEWLSRQDGSFAYIPRCLMSHRIHTESETSAVIGDNRRTKEDYQMFRKFWPSWIAGILSGAYKSSEKSNAV